MTVLKMRHGPPSLGTKQEANSLGTAAIGYLGGGTQLRGLVRRTALARRAPTQARLYVYSLDAIFFFGERIVARSRGSGARRGATHAVAERISSIIHSPPLLLALASFSYQEMQSIDVITVQL